MGEESPVEGAGVEQDKSSCSKRASLALLSLSSTISLSSCCKCLSASCSRFAASCSRLSLSSALICAPIVGCQFNFANQRRQGGKEERNADLLIDAELDAEEVDMALRRVATPN